MTNRGVGVILHVEHVNFLMIISTQVIWTQHGHLNNYNASGLEALLF